ncbi:hypothetical protein [Methylobacterium sp. SyP6R]|uniref:hypothetical protein n=1 Tax=Methylobacterium sp. SyP6R TaxID=2718876 RepID=UPI001F3B6165|nr:hypothetical protein [Methylobacterium sp. SyP6R]MCF4126194.1 hypothetical protein [Methylobacterium sp. SyP6R]
MKYDRSGYSTKCNSLNTEIVQQRQFAYKFLIKLYDQFLVTEMHWRGPGISCATSPSDFIRQDVACDDLRLLENARHHSFPLLMIMGSIQLSLGFAGMADVRQN